MFESALSRLRSGLLVTVFDTSDRIQHMFWRYTEPGHPARSGGASREQNRIIEAMYVRLDALVGKIKGKLGRGDVLIVLSDHGFKSFERGISLNSWLYENGYLALKDGKNESGEWFQDVDWERTKAYAMGLGGLFLNRKGREAKGVVGPEEAPRLKKEIAEKLEALADPGNGKRAIVRVHDRDEVYKGPYVENGPDLIVGYEVGYRASWDSVTGKVGGPVFEANTKCWSGDHCIEPARVPGVFFSNWKCPADHPGLLDMAPTVLRLLGVEPPAYMDGKSLDLEPPEQGV
jgi:predicted AlkP superfamily phosphohydrolase/phosphomutase